MHLPPHVHAVRGMECLAREDVLQVASLDLRCGEAVLASRVCGKGPVAGCEKVVGQVFIVAGGWEPVEGHDVEDAASGAGI